MSITLRLFLACGFLASGCSTVTKGTTDVIDVRTINGPKILECVAANKKG